MEENKAKFTSIDEYISLYPKEIQEILCNLRRIIKEAAPGCEEKISYQMPAFTLNGILVYFGVCKNHIGFYPTANGIETFKEEFKDYKWSKGAVQFPIDQPMPEELITRIVKFRVQDNWMKAQEKMKKSK